MSVLRADVVRPLMPLFGSPEVVATSARQISVERIDLATAVDANFQWHSQLPKVDGLLFGDLTFALGGVFAGGLYGVALWTRPVGANRMSRDTSHLLELRRLAIPDYAPRFTATRLLGRMARWIRREHPQICNLLSYQMTDVHSGTIYKAGNWTVGNQQSSYQSWTTPTRRRALSQNDSPKIRWEYPLQRCDCDSKHADEVSGVTRPTNQSEGVGSIPAVRSNEIDPTTPPLGAAV